MYDVIISGSIRVLVAVLPFLREKFSPIPELTGQWTFVMTTENTSYNPYKQMQLFYLVHITQDGNRFQGTGEKIKEITSTGEYTYPPVERIHIKISGSLKKKYINKSELTILVEEAGSLRKSSAMHNLIVMDNNQLEGVFTSTIAHSSGAVEWKRGNNFSDDSSEAKYNETKTS